MVKYILIALLILNIRNISLSQNPVYFQTTIDNGLPSNEIYSIIKDQKGFIWIGCDAGIYRYNSVRFLSYKNKGQKTKALAGLTISGSGKIYAHSFNGQIFYVENDTLKHLRTWQGKVSAIVCDHDYNLWVCGEYGISSYNERTQKWTRYSEFTPSLKKDTITFTNSCRLTNDSTVSFITPQGIASIKSRKLQLIPFEFTGKKTSGEFILESKNGNTWLLSITDGLCFRVIGNKLHKYESAFLKQALSNSKVTNLKLLEDGNIWICTYSGIICYDPDLDSGRIFYPDMAFSDIIYDDEQNYWITTLRDGILRLPDLNSKTWNAGSGILASNKILKIESEFPFVYFSTLTGQVGRINTVSGDIEAYSIPTKSNIQNLTYCEEDRKLYFNAQNTLYYLESNNIKKVETSFPPIKDFLKAHDSYIIATSIGCFVHSNLSAKSLRDTLSLSWTRAIAMRSDKQELWLATNDGLMNCVFKQNKWHRSKAVFVQKQILCMAYNEMDDLFAVSFDGEVYKTDKNHTVTLIQSLPADIQANQIKVYQNQLFIATNFGVWKLNLKTNTWEVLDKQKGLVSNEILSLNVVNDHMWLATSNGIQMMPLEFKKEIKRASVYLKHLYINNKEVVSSGDLQLEHDQPLGLKLEATAYSSNQNFRFAYRFSNNDTAWVTLPSGMEQIQIRSVPYGSFNLELKIIDYLSQDSVNTISITGYVTPPFWQRWWFYVIISLIGSGIAFVFFRYYIRSLKKKQVAELKRIQLENDLKLSQETALKAQMNPHFVFNVLNSIKGYIYENDKKNAAFYLSGFSDLVRKILNHSTSSEIALREEIETLKLYIELEAMLIQDNFKYSISIDDELDTSFIKIPALIIQPYIENAFKHGLRHKNGEKLLNIGFKIDQEERHLIITITDNGIGRVASGKMKADSNGSHRSFATEATEKRIALLNSDKKDIIDVKIIDNIADGNFPAGTTVVLTILLNDR